MFTDSAEYNEHTMPQKFFLFSFSVLHLLQTPPIQIKLHAHQKNIKFRRLHARACVYSQQKQQQQQQQHQQQKCLKVKEGGNQVSLYRESVIACIQASIMILSEDNTSIQMTG